MRLCDYVQGAELPLGQISLAQYDARLLLPQRQNKKLTANGHEAPRQTKDKHRQ
jgi:hypothetical protein